MRRIAIIGNAGGGKSTLARRLGAALAIPVHEIDLLQWKPGWVPDSPEAIDQTHNQWLAAPAWIIDGWGSWEAIAARFELPDTIIVIDLPLALHYSWVIKMIWQIHYTKRPRLLELAAHYDDRACLAYIFTPHELRWLVYSAVQHE